MPPAEARSLLGPGAIIGYSTHTIEHVIAALALPIDYIAFGPIFSTQSKDSTDTVVGLDGLKAVKKALGSRPLVAIGGIHSSGLLAVLAAGADSAAMIGALVSDPEQIAQRMRKLSELAEGSHVKHY
jgi:thiamine-phosphate pyrophosphorylase